MSIRYNENNRTTNGEADKLLGTTSDAKLPAVDGSQLTNLSTSGGSNSRSLTMGTSHTGIVSVTAARNNIYVVTGSGPTFNITSTLRSSYVDGDIIFIINYGNYYFSVGNTDSANGTKLFVKGTETTSWRFNTQRNICKIRLTTHTNGALYAHVTEDLSILDDFGDVVNTSSSIPVGATLRYNSYLQKWQAVQNWMPKSLVINNANAINYLTDYTTVSLTNGGVTANVFAISTIDMSATSHAQIGTNPANRAPVTGWTEFFADSDFYNYDRFVIVLKIDSNTNMTLYESNGMGGYTTASRLWPMNNVTSGTALGNIAVRLPTAEAKWVGKKITFIVDGINTNNNAILQNRRNSYVIMRQSSGSTDGFIDMGNGTTAGTLSLSFTVPLSNSYGNFIGDTTSLTLMLTDASLYPTKPGSSSASYANKYLWVECPF